METICGVDCSKCPMSNTCKGCVNTSGSPFGGICLVAKCCQSNNYKKCSECSDKCTLKNKIINEFNSLNIKDMPKVTELFELSGSFINLEYTLANDQKIKLLNENDTYLGTQLHKEGAERCYGLTATDTYLIVSEYGENGIDPEIVLIKKR